MTSFTGPNTGGWSGGGATSGGSHAKTGCGVMERRNGSQLSSAEAWAAKPSAPPATTAAANEALRETLSGTSAAALEEAVSAMELALKRRRLGA